MNIITRKKEITEVIEKLNEATKLANDALTGLEELEKLEKKTPLECLIKIVLQ